MSWKDRVRRYILHSLQNYQSSDVFYLETAILLLDQAMHLLWLGVESSDSNNSAFFDEPWPVVAKRLSSVGKSPLEDFENDRLYRLRLSRNTIVHSIASPDFDEADIGEWIWLAVAVADQLGVGFQLDDFTKAPELYPVTRFCTEDHHATATIGRVEYAISQFTHGWGTELVHDNVNLKKKIGFKNQEEEMVYPDIIVYDDVDKKFLGSVEVVTAVSLTKEASESWVKNGIKAVSAPMGYQTLAKKMAEDAGYKGEIWSYIDLPRSDQQPSPLRLKGGWNFSPT